VQMDLVCRVQCPDYSATAQDYNWLYVLRTIFSRQAIQGVRQAAGRKRVWGGGLVEPIKHESGG